METVRDRIDIDFEDMGEVEVKNIERPVHVWRWSAAAKSQVVEVDEADQKSLSLAKPSIAVLPFDNMSGNPEQDYFADGVTEEIIAALARYEELRVIARNSTFTYKQQAADVRQVGRELDAGYVLEGSVRGNAQRIRITAQLINAKTGNHLWSERYDRPLEDVFDLQDEIAAIAASTTASELRRETGVLATQRPAVDLKVWDIHAKAYWHLDRLTAEDIARSQELCQQAIELAPDYAPAHITLSLAYGIEAGSGILKSSRPHSELVSDAQAAARRAIELDNNSYLAHKALGAALFVAGQHEDALREHEMAIRLNPYDPHNHGQMGLTLAYMGAAHSERAIEHLQRTIELSPNDRSIFWWLHAFAMAEFMREDYDQSIAWAHRMAQYLPRSNLGPLRHLAICYALKGDLEASQKSLAAAQQIYPHFTIIGERERLQFVIRNAADLERYLEGLRLAGLPE